MGFPTPDDPITVVLATDSALLGDGLAALLASAPDIDALARARDHAELRQLVETHDPAAVVLSIRTRISDRTASIETAGELHAEHPGLGIVVVSDRGNGLALALLHGVAAHIAYLLDDELPSIDSVLGALRDVRAGRPVPGPVEALMLRHDALVMRDLTAREMDVLEQLSLGLSNAAIADTLHLSVKTIEKNVSLIFRKLDLDSSGGIARRVTACLSYQRAQQAGDRPL